MYIKLKYMKTFFVVAILLCSMSVFSQINRKSYDVENKPSYFQIVPYSHEYLDSIKYKKVPPFGYNLDEFGNKVFEDGNRRIILLPFDNSLKNVFFLLHIKFVYLIDDYEIMPSGKKLKKY